MPKTARRKRWEAEAGLRRFELVSNEEVIAAVDRAERHRAPQRRDDAGVPWWEIVDHLGFVNTGWTTRQLHPQVDGLVTAGMLETSRRHSRTYWTLTDTARKRLATRRRAGKLPDLPESPQHRTWRMARTYAAEHIDRLHAEMSGDLDRAAALLTRGRRTRSDAWFELKERLSRGLWRLGAVTHCLHEWQEPDDATADIDDREDPGDERLSDDAQSRMHWLRNGRRRSDTWGWRDDEEEPVATEPVPALITVPAELVSYLHSGLHNELTVPAEGIMEAVGQADRGPEQYREHFEYLDDVRALLDLVGWAKPKQPAAVAIDLPANRRAVTAALDFAVSGSADELEDAEATESGPKLEAARQRVFALREFTTAVKQLAAELEGGGTE